MRVKECIKCSGSGRNHLDSSGIEIEDVINSKYACDECGGLGQVEDNTEPFKGYWYTDKDGNSAHSWDFEESIGE